MISIRVIRTEDGVITEVGADGKLDDVITELAVGAAKMIIDIADQSGVQDDVCEPLARVLSEGIVASLAELLAQREEEHA